MKKTLLLILLLISIIVLLVRFSNLVLNLSFDSGQKAGLRVLSAPEAKVFIDNTEMGKTPYENSNLQNKEYLIKIQQDNLIWQGKVGLTNGTLAVVNRDLSPD